MKTLFIGGPLDGQRLDVPDDALWWMYAEMPELTFKDDMEPDPLAALPEIKRYRYERVKVSYRETVFWLSDGGVVSPITAMVRKYPDPVSPDVKTLILRLLSIIPNSSPEVQDIATRLTKILNQHDPQSQQNPPLP
jgi:hypothetical protein